MFTKFFDSLFSRSIDSISASFHSIATRLEAHADRHEALAETKEAEVAKLKAEASAHSDEVIKALEVARKIRGLLS